MSSEQLVRDTWESLSSGEVGALEAVLAPDARWRAVEDGPWNCQNREAILEVMARKLDTRLAGHVEEVFDVGKRTVVAFRPDRQGPPAWPLENGIRYVVLSFRDGLVTEMKGCASRSVALAYARGGDA
jgi:ketosteroid isomerase-like protein